MGKDDLTLELERMSSQSDVERELDRLKKEIAPGAAAPQIAPVPTSQVEPAAASDEPEKTG
jgi:phage shock protein A